MQIVCAPTLFLLHPNVISNSHLLQLILSGDDGETQVYRYKVIKSAAWNTDNALDDNKIEDKRLNIINDKRFGNSME